MVKTKICISMENELDKLTSLYEEAVPHFLEVEGRQPLKPLVGIREVIGNPPIEELTYCFTIYYENEVVGYTWVLEKPHKYYYILHFYIGNEHKRKNIGRTAVDLLDNFFRTREIKQSELMVSGSNYLGLKFWFSIGYDKIIYIESPGENSPTSSVEIELSRSF